MSERRSASFCLVHQMDFPACPCPDRRTATRSEQVLVCELCNRHVGSHDDVACPEPDYQIRSAA